MNGESFGELLYTIYANTYISSPAPKPWHHLSPEQQGWWHEIAETYAKAL